MSRQPTLADVPGILLRGVFTTVARLLLVTGGLLLLGSLFLMTWRSARPRHAQVIMDALTAVAQVFREFH